MGVFIIDNLEGNLAELNPAVRAAIEIAAQRALPVFQRYAIGWASMTPATLDDLRSMFYERWRTLEDDPNCKCVVCGYTTAWRIEDEVSFGLSLSGVTFDDDETYCATGTHEGEPFQNSWKPKP